MFALLISLSHATPEPPELTAREAKKVAKAMQTLESLGHGCVDPPLPGAVEAEPASWVEVEAWPQSDLTKAQHAALSLRIASQDHLYHQAIEKGLLEDPDVQLRLARAARRVLAQTELERRIDTKVTPEAVQAFYEKHPAYAVEQARAGQILVSGRKKASEVMKRLKSGEAFESVAKDLSEDGRTRESGGDLGWLDRSRVIPALESALFDGELGELQGPVQTRFGMHILEPRERRDRIPLEAVEDTIRSRLRREARAAILKAALGDPDNHGTVVEE